MRSAAVGRIKQCACRLLSLIAAGFCKSVAEMDCVYDVNVVSPSVCPSDLRGYVQVVMFSNAWAQIPQLTNPLLPATHPPTHALAYLLACCSAHSCPGILTPSRRWSLVGQPVNIPRSSTFAQYLADCVVTSSFVASIKRQFES